MTEGTRRPFPRLVRACAVWALLVMPVTAQEPAVAQPDLPVLTVAEAASLLRVDPEELRRLAERQDVPARRVGTDWRFSRAALMAWLNGDWEVANDRAVRHQPLATEQLRQVRATGLTAPQATATAQAHSPSEQNPPDKPIGEAPEERTAGEVFLRGRRVLLGRGEVVIDFGQFFARGDDLQLIAADQRIGLATVRQEALTSLLVGRVGIFRETELFAATTFQNYRSHVFLGNDTLASGARNRVGDVTLGVNRTLLRESAGRPDVIGSMAVRLPLHDNPYAVTAGITAVKSVDPVVLFANVSYSDTVGAATLSDLRFEPVATVGTSVGYGLALNDTTAISTTFSGLFTGAATLNGVTQKRAQLFSGRFALTSRLANGLYVEPSVTFGISGPGESVAFGVTIPYSF
jgi:excisionase family DNA binding protein